MPPSPPALVWGEFHQHGRGLGCALWASTWALRQDTLGINPGAMMSCEVSGKLLNLAESWLPRPWKVKGISSQGCVKI